MSNERWGSRRLERVNTDLAKADAPEVLSWASETFAPDLALATSFGPQTIVLMHMAAEIGADVQAFYLDTNLLFPQTYTLRDQLIERLGISVTQVKASLSLEAQAERFGDRLWGEQPNLCCELRKVLPLRHYLSKKKAWLTGIRRRQTAFRSDSQIVEWDEANGLVKINPLVGWSTEQVWNYIREHDLPYNMLHDQGFPSIGCYPCTRAVREGEDARSGRWSGRDKTECGIHLKHLPSPGTRS